MEDEAETRKTDGWVKVQSKSRPGRYYLFNRMTGETKWLPTEKQHENKSTKDATGTPSKRETENEAPPKISAAKPLKTPAQDRLKRLQHSIKLDRLKKDNNKKSKRHSESDILKYKHLTDRVEQQENVSSSREYPTTSSTKKEENPLTILNVSTMKPPAKRLGSSNNSPPSPKEEVRRKVPKKSPDKNKTLIESQESNTATKEIIGDILLDSKDINNTPSTSKNITSEPGLFSKIKEMLMLPFSSFKDSSTLRESGNDQSSPECTPRKLRKIWDNTESPDYDKPTSSSPFILDALNEHRNQKKQCTSEKDDQSERNSSLQGSSKSFPNYQKRSANSRLDRLRQSLMQHQLTPTNSKTSSTADSSYPTSSNSSFSLDNEIEAMDWQPTETSPLSLKEPVSSFESIKIKTEPGKKPPETMGDIYDAVSENLLRLSAEKKRERSRDSRKWLKDYYYFVVDTNVLLDHLSFLDDLSTLKLCDTQGSVLYIPYAVLQELDKLKMRSGNKEAVKTMAIRAINYLNKKFESNNLNLQAQSAVEEHQHLIEVTSADDSIINCCLQAKDNVPNLVLLTEDINLRNKAICNHILVTTKSDLLYKRFDDKPNERVSL